MPWVDFSRRKDEFSLLVYQGNRLARWHEVYITVNLDFGGLTDPQSPQRSMHALS